MGINPYRKSVGQMRGSIPPGDRYKKETLKEL